MTFSVLVWGNTATMGTYHHVLLTNRTVARVLDDFQVYLSLTPERYRCFNASNIITLHGPNGRIRELLH